MLGFAGQPAVKTAASALEPAAATPAALRAIDLVSYGFDREVDHGFWMRTSARVTL